MIKKITLLLLFTIAIVFNSCKKELIVPNAPTQARASNVKQINYSAFLNAVDENKLGILKKSLGHSPQGKIQSIADNNVLGTLAVLTDSLQQIVENGDTCFVFRMALTSPQAITFRNLTVKISNGNISAFIATYTPTSKWIDARKSKRPIAFDGDISIAPIKLSSTTLLQSLSYDSAPATGGKTMSIGGVKKSVVQEVCNDFLVYNLTAYGCSKGGHYDFDDACVWNTGTEVPPGEHRGGWEYTAQTVTVCYNVDMGPDGTGNNGGGGGTTPNPPPDYDPCKCGPTQPNPVESIQRHSGLALAVVAPNCCEGGQLPPPPPSTPFQVSALISLLQNRENPNPDYIAYINQNHALGIELYNLLAENDFSPEAVAATELTIAAAKNQVINSTNATLSYNATWGELGFFPHDPQTFGIYFAIQCTIVRAEHPSYSNLRVYWEASKEMIHLALDGIGLVPGVGEIADLTNGVIYTIEGRGVDAALSYAGAIPFAGWFATGAKFAKKTIAISSTASTTLKWVVMAGNVVKFGDRTQLRKVLGLAVGDARQAHHLLPWGKQTHVAIQKAAKAKNPFHMNELLNGIPLNTAVHNGSHAAYDANVLARLDNIPANATPDQAKAELLDIIADIRTAIQNNPNTHINNLVF